MFYLIGSMLFLLLMFFIFYLITKERLEPVLVLIACLFACFIFMSIFSAQFFQNLTIDKLSRKGAIANLDYIDVFGMRHYNITVNAEK